MVLTPHLELITTPEAAHILGISPRELEYWKQLHIGPTPIIILTFDGTKKSFFVKKEIVNLSKNIHEFEKIKIEFREKSRLAGFKSTKPHYD